jgi:hypothetical protein
VKTSVIDRQAWRCLALGLVVVSLIAAGGLVEAQEREVRITSREVVERLTRLEEGQKRLEQRIDGVQTNLGQRIDDIRDLVLWGFGITFAGMFALVGFVIWDRRTALAPAARRIEDLQDRERRLEEALKRLSKDDPKLAEILRSLGLL